MARFLGVDYGLERTGVALADGDVVIPLATLQLAQWGNRRQMLDALAALAYEKQVEAVIMGLPIKEDGSESLTSLQVRNVARRLGRRLTVPLHFMPELLSSHEAHALLRARGLKGDKLRSVLDQMAACRILSAWLAQRRESP